MRQNGRTKRPEYQVWRGMRDRCNNPNDTRFKYYGARGIRVCKRWDSFDIFLSDMGPRPTSNHTIERLKASGPYSPKNCRWATMKEQARNRSSNHRLTFEGQTKTLTEWAESAGISPELLRYRLRHWPKDALFEPARKYRPRVPSDNQTEIRVG